MNKAIPYLPMGLFALCLLSRLAFMHFTGFDHYELFGDALRYDMLSDRILAGNYNLDMVAFITAPLYPWVMAIVKLLAPDNWPALLTTIQFILVALSAVWLYRLSLFVFSCHLAACLSSLLYIFYPLTLWYNYTFTQETVFQSLFIFFSYYMIRSLSAKGLKTVVTAAVMFSLCFLCKTFIIILLPFLVLILMLSKKARHGLIFTSVFILLALPNALNNYRIHKAFSLTGFSAGSMFLIGHSDTGYRCLTNAVYAFPEIRASGCNLDIVFDPPYDFGKYGKPNLLPLPERNTRRICMALDWIRDNPVKFLELKWNSIRRFILPGLDHRIYNRKYWLISFGLGLLIYIPAYIILFRSLQNRAPHAFFTSAVFLSIAILFIVFYPQNRFRVISMELMMMVYAGYYYAGLARKWFNP